jgi:methylglutaconyl-CoA hydratase
LSDHLKTLRTDRDGALLRVRLNSPETGNAVDERMLDELLGVLHATADEPGIRVLVLSGAGQDFCLGGDRQEFGTLVGEDPSGGSVRALAGKARRVCDALAASSAVTIARLHGGVIGAGLGLALFCDLRAGADTSRYRLPELALGLPAVWGGALPRLLSEAGTARIRELILTGAGFDATSALRMSVLHRVVPEADLDRCVAEWTRPVLRRSPTALRVTKAALNAYAASARMADATLLEGDLMAAVIAAARYGHRP